eukprot:g18463.t1
MEQLSRWANFKRVAVVLLGEPPLAFKKYGQDVTLRVKQEISDTEFRAKQTQAESLQEAEEAEPPEQEPPSVELTDEEKKRWFSKRAVPDLTMYEWQKALAGWHAKQSSWKASEAKRLAEAAQREQKKKVYEAQVAEAQKEGKETRFSRLTYLCMLSRQDWSMLTLRFELHLLSHAFRKDANDPDRLLVPLDHLPFYYNRYFKKALSTKTYGAETVEEVARLVRDTLLVTKNPISKLRVLESQLPEELELDLGDSEAKLRFITPNVASNVVTPGSVSPGSASSPTAAAAAAAASTVLRPSTSTVTLASPSGAASPPPKATVIRPIFGMPGLRPPAPGPVRPLWRGW